MSDIKKIINEAWENRDNVNQDSEQSLKDGPLEHRFHAELPRA